MRNRNDPSSSGTGTLFFSGGEMSTLESGNAVLQTIHSSEGGRALKLLHQRQKTQKELESARSEIEQETKKRKLHKIEEKYKGSSAEALEESFKKQTLGLQSADEFREKRKKFEELIAQKASEEAEASLRTVAARRREKPRPVKSKLSFVVEEEEEQSDAGAALCRATSESLETEGSLPAAVGSPLPEAVNHDKDFEPTADSAAVGRKRRFGKDPTVDTSFLADAERDERIQKEREKWIEEYRRMQDAIKEELVEVTYSYWTGSGHRRTALVKKGSTVGQFLGDCCRLLAKEFPELRSASKDSLMFIKEDIILPHHVTFFELIQTKARGKSGPLFNFDVHDDVRVQADVRVEKDESHAGKVVERKWYERNKHIFPASRWEHYDTNKTYQRYTIRGE